MTNDAAPIERDDLGPYVKFHRLTSHDGAGLIAVRPDGYVGYRSGVGDERQLATWVEPFRSCRRP